MPAVYVKSRDQ